MNKHVCVISKQGTMLGSGDQEGKGEKERRGEVIRCIACSQKDCNLIRRIWGNWSCHDTNSQYLLSVCYMSGTIKSLLSIT